MTPPVKKDNSLVNILTKYELHTIIRNLLIPDLFKLLTKKYIVNTMVTFTMVWNNLSRLKIYATLVDLDTVKVNKYVKMSFVGLKSRNE